MKPRLRPFVLAAALSVALPLLGACSGSVSTGDSAPTVSTEELEKSIASRLTVDGEAAADTGIEITCEDELPAEVGATVDCFGTDAEGGRTGFRPTVTAVDGDDIEYEAPLFIPGDELAEQLRTELEKQGYALSSVECDEAAGEAGATSTCTAQVEDVAEPDTLTITIDELDGLRFRFSYEVAA